MGDSVTIMSGVHHHVEGGGTAPFWQRAGEGEGVTAVPRAVHRPIFPESKVFMGLS